MTYFGIHIPEWTGTCQRVGNVVNFIQHWLYSIYYLKVALFFELSFQRKDAESNAKRNKYERAIGYLNGSVYTIFFVSFFVLLFTDLHIYMTVVFTATSFLMTIILAFSMKRITRLIEMLQIFGLSPMTTVMVI